MTRHASASLPAADQPRLRMSFEEFLEWETDDPHVEWVNGAVIKMPSITDEHNQTTVFLLTLLSTFVESRHLGVVHAEPFQMKTGPDLPSRAPDLLFVAKKNLSRRKRLYVDGPADMVVEVISPGSRGTDRGAKYYEYEQGGVREYWLIDPERKRAEFYRRGRDGLYALVELEDGIFRSSVVKGLWLKVDWLWTRPPILDVLKAWDLV